MEMPETRKQEDEEVQNVQCEHVMCGTQRIVSPPQEQPVTRMYFGAAVTQSIVEKEPRKQVSASLNCVVQFIEHECVSKEQARDPALRNIRQFAMEGSEKRNEHGLVSTFICKDKRFYRQVILPLGEEKLQFVVPRKYRVTAMELCHVKSGTGCKRTGWKT